MSLRVEHLTIPERARTRESPFLSPRLERVLSLLRVPMFDARDPRVERLRRASIASDPLADELVEHLRKAGATERRAFENALDSGIDTVSDAPPALRRFFEQVESVPAFLDRDLVRLGTRALQRHGPDANISLTGVLISGYLTVNATKPLVMTGKLTELAPQRLESTGKFVRHVIMSGDMGRFSDGFKTTIRVRLMHAQVRRKLLDSPRWKIDPWGVPINQRDMVVTHLQFTASYLLGTMALGRIDTREEREAIMHVWRYVSYLLGADDTLLPKTFREGLELLRIFNATERGPDDDGRALADAYIRVWYGNLPASGGPQKAVGDFLSGYSRYFMGKQAADALGIPDTAWKHAPLIRAALRAPWEIAQRFHPALRRRETRQGKAFLTANLGVPMSARPSSQGDAQLQRA